MSSESSENKTEVCGYPLVPESHDEYLSGRFNATTWYEDEGGVYCNRQASIDETVDRCIWHAQIEEKSDEAIELAREHRPERLDNAFLKGVHFERPIFFRRCRLVHADLSYSNFEAADFSHADLREVLLENASLPKANFSDSNLSRAVLASAELQEADLTDTDLREANLTRVNLKGADLRGADLRGANLTQANLQAANLFNADLREADLSGADLENTKLTHTNLSRATLLHATLHAANLSAATLQSANLVGADLTGADLTNANLQGADCSGADLLNASLKNTNLTSVVLESTQYRLHDILESDLPLSYSVIRNGLSKQTPLAGLFDVLTIIERGAQEGVASVDTIVILLGIIGGVAGLFAPAFIGVPPGAKYWIRIGIILFSATFIVSLSLYRLQRALGELLEVTDGFFK